MLERRHDSLSIQPTIGRTRAGFIPPPGSREPLREWVFSPHSHVLLDGVWRGPRGMDVVKLPRGHRPLSPRYPRGRGSRPLSSGLPAGNPSHDERRWVSRVLWVNTHVRVVHARDTRMPASPRVILSCRDYREAHEKKPKKLPAWGSKLINLSSNQISINV